MKNHPHPSDLTFDLGKRHSVAKLLGLSAAALLSPFASGAELPKSFRVGYQKGTVILLLTKQRQGFETRLQKIGINQVDWIEFQSGPPMLEAITAKSVDLGSVGDTAPIFAQAGGGDIVYSLAVPTSPHAVLVPEHSPIRTLADLKGKQIAVTKGSSAHNFLIKALKIGGLSWNDIRPAYLGPAEASPAFNSGKIDAWAIWDPYFALAEEKFAARVIASPEQYPSLSGLSFFVASSHFAQNAPAALHAVNDALIDTIQWADTHRDEVARLAATVTGIELSIQQRAIARAPYGYSDFTPALLDEQQTTADAFFEQKLIPKKINIRDIVWRG
jgi:sulfonate transport system substrate-binding protein